MAKKIQIDIEVNGKMQKATLSAKKLRKELDGLEGAQDRQNKSSRNVERNMQGLSKRAGNTTKEFSKMQQGVGGLVGVYATVAAQVFAVSAAFQFLKSASDVNNLIESQKALGAVSGVAYQTLTAGIREATAGQLSFAEASRAAAIGTASGLSPTQLNGLANAAKNASVALGRDLTDSFNRLIRGTTKAEPELLDELGIVLRLDTALEKYGQSIGKSADDLNAFERSQAVANEVLGQAETKFGLLEEAMDPAAFALNQFTNSFDEIVNSVKTGLIGTLIPAFQFLAGNTAALTASLTLFALPIIRSILPNLQEWREQSKKTYDLQTEKLEEAREATSQYRLQLGKLTEEQAKQSREADKLAKGTGATSKAKEGGLAFIQGAETAQTKKGQAAADKMLLHAEQQLKESATRRTGALKHMNAQQVADARKAYMIRSGLMKAHEVQEVTGYKRMGVHAKLYFSSVQAMAAKTAAVVATASQFMARAMNFALMATGIIGIISLLASLALAAKDFLFPVSDAVKQVEDEADQLQDKLGTLTGEILRMGDAMADPRMGLVQSVQLLGKAVTSLELKKQIDDYAALAKSQNLDEGQKEKLKQKLDNLVDAVGSLDPELQALAETYRADPSPENAKNLQKLEEQIKAASSASAQLTETTRAQNAALTDLAGAASENSVLQGLNTAVKAQTEALTLIAAEEERIAGINKANHDDRLTQLKAERDEKIRGLKTSFGTAAAEAKLAKQYEEEYQQGIADAEAKLAADDKQSAARQEQLKDQQRLQAAINTAMQAGVALRTAATETEVEASRVKTAGLTLEGKLANNASKRLSATAKLQTAGAALVEQQKLLDEFEKQGAKRTPEELANQQRKVDLAQAAFDIAGNELNILLEKLSLEDQLAVLRDRSAASKEAADALKAQQAANNELDRERQIRQEIFDLTKSQAEKQIELEGQRRSVANPFFDEQQFGQTQALELEKRTAETQKQQVIDNFKLRLQAIDLEYDLLEAQKAGRIADLQGARASAKARMGDILSDSEKKVLADFDEAIKLFGKVDYEGARGAAVDLAKAIAAGELTDLEGLIESLELGLEKASGINQVFEAGAGAFKDGLGDAIGATFDAMTGRVSSLKDALKGIAQDVLQTVQDAFIDQMLVRPIIEGLGGQEEEFDPVAASTKIKKETIDAHLQGALDVRAKIKEGSTSGGEQLKESIIEACEVGAAKLKTAVTPEDPTAAESREERLNRLAFPEELKVPLETLGDKPTAAQAAAENPLSSGGIDSMINDIAGMNTGEGEEGAKKKGLFAGLGEKFNKFTADFGNIFDKNSEGGFLEKLGKAFTSGGDLFSGLFDNLGSMFSDLLGGLGGGGGMGGGGWMSAAMSLFGFEKGGIVQDKVSAYSTGGVARGPQSGYPAVLHGNEAVVPLPDGKSIPVSMQGMPGAGATQNNVTVNVTIDNDGNAQSSTSADSDQASNLGNLVALAVQKELQNQKRSGGILSPHGVA